MSRKAYVEMRLVDVDAGKSLLLATFGVGSEAVVVNSSITISLASELRKFLELSCDPVKIQLQITQGKDVLSSSHPVPDGLNVSDAIELLSAKARVDCSLDVLRSSQLPGFVDHKLAEKVKVELVELSNKCNTMINSILSGESE